VIYTIMLQGNSHPNNVKLLGRIVHASNHNWPRIWERLQGFFIVSEDGQWISQKRMTEELEKARDRQEKQKDNADQRWKNSGTGSGKKAATSNKQKSSHFGPNPLTNNEQGDATAYANARARVPLPIFKEKEEEKERTEGTQRVRAFVALDTPQWRAWQSVKLTPMVYSREHHANGWWFPSEWPANSGAVDNWGDAEKGRGGS
jgi:uncharacterized protein YdaU (DUF1376 family)